MPPRKHIGYERTHQGTLERHVFKTREELLRWLDERRGLTMASEGGRDILRRTEEERLMQKYSGKVVTITH